MGRALALVLKSCWQLTIREGANPFSIRKYIEGIEGTAGEHCPQNLFVSCPIALPI